MVQDAKLVAININDSNAVSRWRESNRSVSSIKHESSFNHCCNQLIYCYLL